MSDTPQQSGPRILVISATVGAGHNQAARAIVEKLADRLPGATLEVIDSLKHVPAPFRMYYSGGFGVLMARLGRLYGFGYWMFDRPQRPARGVVERQRLLWERLNTIRLGKRIEQWRPDLIINTHFFSPPVVARLKAQGRINCPQLVQVTDVLAHRWWYSEGVEHWFLPQPATAPRFALWGISPQRITVSGIPIMKKWSLPVDAAKARADWKLPEKGHIVMLSAGAEFTAGPVAKIARGIADRCRGATVVVLAGRNKKLLARLSALPEARDGRLVPVAFTDRNHELLAAASLMVGKAGGVTTAECLATGTPMVLIRPVPGQEKNNALFFASQGAAVLAASASEAVEHARRLLETPDELRRLSQTARSLYRPATDILADYVVKLLGES
jgi:processive 1,2-diacylglycerol beta-glucosyltransferase